jgi:signal transduction histidine kinase
MPRNEERQEGKLQHRLRVLHRIDQAILEIRPPQQTAQNALRSIRELLPFDQASVILFEFDDAQASVFVHVDGAAREAEGRKVPVDSEWMSRLEEGKPIVHEDVSSLERTPPCLESLIKEGLRSAIVVPLFAKRRLTGVLNIARREPGPFPREHVEIAQELGTSLAVSLQNACLMESTTRSREQLRGLRTRLAQSEEATRYRIARELHDRVGQYLTALSVNLGIIRKKVGPDCAPELQGRVEDCVRLVDDIGNQIEGVTDELRPAILDDYGLIATLRWYGDLFAKRTGVSVNVRSRGLSCRLPEDVETALFRICQEAFTNVAKHAEANNVLVWVAMKDDVLRLTVQDDGKGLAPPCPDGLRTPGHWGLVTMRERALGVGGTCTVRPAGPAGTEVVVEVTDPLRHGEQTAEAEHQSKHGARQGEGTA